MALELSGLARAAKLGLIDSEGRVTRSEFYLTNLETEEEIQLCMIPESVKVKTGASFRSYNIVERGEIKLPKGEQLTQISWQGIFPGAGVLLYPGITHAAWDNPEEIIRDLERWKSDGDKIKLLVTETPINLEVYIRSFEWEASGGMGNFKYSIDLIAAKDLEVMTVAEADAKRAEQTELKSRPRMKSTIGQKISDVDDIWSAVKILTGNGSLADVERVFGGNGLSLDSFEPTTLIWG